MPFVGVVVLPVEDDAAHIVGGAQVVGDGGVLHVRIGGPTGGRGGFVAVPSLVSGEVGAALHVGGGGGNTALKGDVGALGQGHNLVVAAGIAALGQVAVHLKLAHAHVPPVGHRGAVPGHPQTHILGGDRSIQLVLGLPSGVVGDALLGGPVRAVSGGLNDIVLDVLLLIEHLEPSDGALLAQVQLEPAHGGTLTTGIVAGTPAGGILIVAVDGGGGGIVLGLGIRGRGHNTIQTGQVADGRHHLFAAIHLELVHGHVEPAAAGHGSLVPGDTQADIAGLHGIGQFIGHLGVGGLLVLGHLGIPITAIIGGLDVVLGGVGGLPVHLKAVDGVGSSQVVLQPALGNAVVVVGGPAGRLGAGVSVSGLVSGVAGVGLRVGGGGGDALQPSQVHVFGLGLHSRGHEAAGEHHSSQGCGKPSLVGFLHAFTPLPSFLVWAAAAPGTGKRKSICPLPPLFVGSTALSI